MTVATLVRHWRPTNLSPTPRQPHVMVLRPAVCRTSQPMKLSNTKAGFRFSPDAVLRAPCRSASGYRPTTAALRTTLVSPSLYKTAFICVSKLASVQLRGQATFWPLAASRRLPTAIQLEADVRTATRHGHRKALRRDALDIQLRRRPDRRYSHDRFRAQQASVTRTEWHEHRCARKLR